MPRLTLFFICFLFLAPTVAQAADPQATHYRRAFAALKANNPALAETLAAKGQDPVLNKVIRGHAMALPGNGYSFNQLSSFMAQNPNWPGIRGIQMIAEQKFPASMSATEIVGWFSQRSPINLVGFYRYIDALNKLGYEDAAIQAVQARWSEGSFSKDEQTAFHARFDSWLTYDDLWKRTDRLLWRNDGGQVSRMLPYLEASHRAVAEARLAFLTQNRHPAILLRDVPARAQNDPGILYLRLSWAVKNNRDDEAVEILLNAPSDLGSPEAWWEQRHIMVRRAIENRNYDVAYRLASDHGQKDARSLVQAEFLSGWLSLRFLNKPHIALKHFHALYDAASTPISRARGAYWTGRAYEALGNKADAEQAYQDSAIFNTTFYGQLATTRIYAQPFLLARMDPAIPTNVRKAFFAQDNIRAIKRLAEIGQIERARSFLVSTAENTTKRADFILLTEIAAQIKRPDFGILVVKAANQKNILIQNGGFPLIGTQVPTPPEPAFTHALIRQESTFNPEAVSRAGARGLMQLMPATANETAKSLGLRFRKDQLNNPNYNIKLGTTFMWKQLNRFDGSYIVSLAAYNAGPGRVREWIAKFGDPRDPGVDPIDWIEMLPIAETRNYVQRIMENLQIYRSKLAGGNAPLLILNDLKR